MIAALLLATVSPVLADYSWFPSSGEPWKTAIGVRGSLPDREIASLQIGLPGQMPRQLTRFRVDCARKTITSVDFYAVDAELTTVTPMASVPFAAVHAASADMPPIPFTNFAGALGEMLTFGCDDGWLAATPSVPIAALDQDATYLPAEQDK